jgi:ribosomal protein S18 acetylase RimI-like enzyme
MHYHAALYGSARYQEAVRLRDQVLRIPLGMRLLESELAKESADIHLVGSLAGGPVLASATLTMQAGALRVRQVAVHPDHQGAGLGQVLMREAEHIAACNCFPTVTLHAREAAFRFYERLGYAYQSEIFEEVGIRHRVMSRSPRLRSEV